MSQSPTTTLRIYSDSPLTAAAQRLLVEGCAPHEVTFSSVPSSSVLDIAAADPAFASADIAFGQPDIANALRSERLRWIQLTSAGYTRYDTAEFRDAVAKRGIVVTNSSAVFAEACAEHALAFLLAQARRLPRALQSRSEHDSPEWNHLRNAAVPLRRQRVLVLGCGAIARRLVELLRPFEMHIVAYRRRPRGDEVVSVVSLERLPRALAEADHVINTLPENPESAKFMSAELFAAMKPGAAFYNIGRGATVDQDALLHALGSGRLDAAWLDVTEPEPLPPDHPLENMPNCFITPHTAGGHRNETETLVRHFLDNLRRLLNGAELRDRIM